MSLQIRRVSYALGAEVSGISIDKPLDKKDLDAVKSAFLEHCVLVFRGQLLTAEQHIAFTQQFGEVDNNNEGSERFKHPKYSQVGLVFNPKVKGKPTDQYQGEHWHSDRSFTCKPTAITLLRSLQIPSVGGDTMFANMYLAYETLSDGMKKLIEGVEGIHYGGGSANRRERGEVTLPVAQPLVRIHPETGRKALYTGEFSKVIQLVGMTEAESRPLIEFLCDHATRPQFCYRHVWRKDDLVMWDNRCTLHRALGDFDRSENRDMERTTVVGTPSGRTYEQPLAYEGIRR